MLHFYDRATIGGALTLDLDPRLRALLTERINALGDELIDCTEYLVVQAGDNEEAILRHVGFSPLIEPINGARFGEAGFAPHWDYLADHGGWFELIFTFGSTFGYVVFVQDTEGVPTGLLTMCRVYACA